MEDSKLDTRILTVRVRRVTEDVFYDGEDGHVVAMEGSDIELYLYGFGLSNDTVVRLTTSRGEYGDDCLSTSDDAQAQSGDLHVFEISSEMNRARLSIKAEQVHNGLCGRIFASRIAV